MIYVVVIAVIGILLVQWTGAIPQGSVGGPLMVALAVLLATLALAIVEAWSRRRGVLGFVVNIVVAFAGMLVVAPLGGAAMAMLLIPFMDGSSSLAGAGGPLFSVALAGQMAITLAGSWAALLLLNRWRDRRGTR